MDEYGFCRPLLQDGEQVLWQGRPEKGRLFASAEPIVLIIGAAWLFLAGDCLHTAWQTGSGALAALAAVLLVPGLLILAAKPLRTARLRDKTWYVVTDRQILVKQGGRVAAHPLRELTVPHLRTHRGGAGTLLFCGRGLRGGFALENLADAEAARDAVMRMAQSGMGGVSNG